MIANFPFECNHYSLTLNSKLCEHCHKPNHRSYSCFPSVKLLIFLWISKESFLEVILELLNADINGHCLPYAYSM